MGIIKFLLHDPPTQNVNFPFTEKEQSVIPTENVKISQKFSTLSAISFVDFINKVFQASSM